MNEHSKTSNLLFILKSFIYRKKVNYQEKSYVECWSRLLFFMINCYRCEENELNQFEEVDLSYLSSTTLTIQYDSILALDQLISS